MWHVLCNLKRTEEIPTNPKTSPKKSHVDGRKFRESSRIESNEVSFWARSFINHT